MDDRLEPLLENPPAWLLPGGPESDVVVATRIRLARNVSGLPFPHLISAKQAADLCEQARERLGGIFPDNLAIEPGSLSQADGDLLVERSLASRDLLESSRPALVLFNAEESLGLMVNEEDHFRSQSFAAGLNFDVAFKVSQPLMHSLSERFNLARHRRFGYLTACPSNVGTGMRASLLVHLPALSRNNTATQQAMQAARGAKLAVRGVHGEGSRALGHLFQISNQLTLGSEVPAQMKLVEDFARQLVSFERRTRQELLSDASSRAVLIKDIKAHYRLLCEAPGITSAQALNSLSILRLAMNSGLDQELGFQLTEHQLLLNSFQIQPGHLQGRIGCELKPSERDASRAQLLRSALCLPS